MSRVLFKDIVAMEEVCFRLEKHSNNKAKHYIATIDKKAIELVYNGKLADMQNEIKELGFEAFVEKYVAEKVALLSKKATKAQKLALDGQITDLVLKIMRLGNVRNSDEDKALRAELRALKKMRDGEDKSLTKDAISEAVEKGTKKRAVKKAKAVKRKA